MATPKSVQTPVKVYRPSFLDTTGDLRPSVERELVSISNALQNHQIDIDALKNHMTADEAVAAGFLRVEAAVKMEPDGTAIQVGPNYIKINTIIRSSVANSPFLWNTPLYSILKSPLIVPNGKTLKVTKPYGPALMELNHSPGGATRSADCWTPKLTALGSVILASPPLGNTSQQLDWLMIKDEWYFDYV